MKDDSKAKMSILKEMRKMAMDDMGEGLKSGMKKVTVASPSEEGLKEGLEKAEDVIEDMPDEEESGDNSELQKIVDMCSSPEELDEKIEFLQKAKEEKYGSSEMDDMEDMSEEME